MLEQPVGFIELLRTLDSFDVEFVVVGALAAVLRGAPITTFDVDIVHQRSAENVAKLVSALRSIHAYYWEHTARRLEPEERTLLLSGHHLLRTDLGQIDVLGTIGANRDYEMLATRSTLLEIAPDVSVRVLDLDVVIETKREANRPKDRAALPVLEQTLREIRRAADG